VEEESELENGLQPHSALIAAANVLHKVDHARILTRIFQDLPSCSRIWAFPLEVVLPSDEQVSCMSEIVAAK